MVILHPETTGLGRERTGGIVCRFGFSGGQGNAVDGGICIANRTDRVIDAGFASSIQRFADEQDRPAIFKGLLSQKINRKSNAVENRRSVIAQRNITDRLG